MKEDRVEFRTSHQERMQFEIAATYLGMNLSAFLRMAALERSAEVVQEKNVLVLSDADRDIFLAALEKPPKPNKNLKKAFLEYKKRKFT
ncbi:MAG: DUF1778 domain-containing protein [Parachlamydia sp.]|jgi:uncharacterized protein (DUF1778 family)|nr:DUF1778 domain-containing protein [Parachlamydia sp.]